MVVATARDAAGAPHFEIDGLAIRGFPGAGLIADSTDNLVLRHVESADNALYGLHVRFARRPHIEGTFVHGNQDTSVFLLGVDGARVRRSRVENNRGEGVIFLETAQSTARRNDLRGNCTGVSVVDLGLVPGTSEGNVAAQNRMRANDNFCPENQNGAGNPSFSGIGVLVAGAVGTQVRFNDVAEHQASAETDLPPGGIVVIASAPQGGRDSGATDVGRNHLRDDGPFDLLWDGTGIGVTFSGNRCATSAPDGLCGAGE